MAFFIEVTSRVSSIKKKIKGDPFLHAPCTPRYRRLLSPIRVGDRFLHYTTRHISSFAEWKGAFIAESIAASEIAEKDNQYLVRLEGYKLLPMAVKLKLVKDCKDISDRLSRAIRMSMQSYLFQIEESDYNLIKDVSLRPNPEQKEWTIIKYEKLL